MFFQQLFICTIYTFRKKSFILLRIDIETVMNKNMEHVPQTNQHTQPPRTKEAIPMDKHLEGNRNITPLTNDGRICASAPYAQLAVSRLCGTGAGTCELRLLCTRCGINETVVMRSLSRGFEREHDDKEMQKLLRYKLATGNKDQMLVPSTMVVIDAISVLRASQREAVVTGAGLNGAIRPIQGPVCEECSTVSILMCQPLEQSLDMGVYDADDEKSSIPSSPQVIDCHETSIFSSRHCDLLKMIDSLKITDDGMTTDLQMNEDCQCAYSSKTTCTGTRTTTMKNCEKVKDVINFALVFGYEDKKIDITSNESVYEICIVDTRHQRMCHIAHDKKIKLGLQGQYNYFNAFRACETPVVPVTATLVEPPVNATGMDQISTTGMDQISTTGMDSVVMTTYTTREAEIPRCLMPPTNASCFVCCSLLEDKDDSLLLQTGSGKSSYNRPRHTNVYLKSHSNWAHKDCTVPCEIRRLGVCMITCPRLNTFVSTQFDATPRFENVCTACTSYNDKSTTPNSSKSKVSSSGKLPKKECKTDTGMATSSPQKRRLDENWLSGACLMRKKAAINLAKQQMTQKQREASEVYVHPVDKSGVYNDKIQGTWYTLDTQGENPMPVCGLPFGDTYFNGIRTWSTLGERVQAIASHQFLLEVGEM